MPRQEGPKPIGDSIRKIIDKVMKERAKNKKGKPIRTQPKLPGLKRGRYADKRKKFGSDEFSTYNKMRDMMDSQRKMQQRQRDMEKDKQKILEKKKGIAVKSGGMMKYNKGGGADMGAKKKKYNRPPQTRNKMQPSRSMSRDTTTGISKMKEGGICRGAGAAIKGTKFQGVF